MVHAPEEKPSFTAADAQTAVNDLGRSRGLHNGVPTTTAGAAGGGAASGGGGSGASAGEMEEPAPVVDPELFDDYELDSEDDDDDDSGGEGGARGGAPLAPGPGPGPGSGPGGLPPPPSGNFKVKQREATRAAEPEGPPGGGAGPSLEKALAALEYDLDAMIEVRLILLAATCPRRNAALARPVSFLFLVRVVTADDQI